MYVLNNVRHRRPLNVGIWMRGCLLCHTDISRAKISHCFVMSIMHRDV